MQDEGMTDISDCFFLILKVFEKKVRKIKKQNYFFGDG